MVVFVETSPSKKTVNVEPSPVNKKVVVSDVSSNQVVVQTSKNNNSVFISRKEAKNVYVQREGGGGLQVDSPTVNGGLLAGDTDGTYYWTQPYTHPVYKSFDTNPDHIISQIKTNYKGHVIDIITKDPSTSSDVWDADENGLYYSNNVGIGGHSSADAKLKVHGDIIATGGIMAYADDGSFGSIWDNIPLATKDSVGGVKAPHDETDTSTNMYIDSNGILQVSGDLSDLSQHSVTELNDVNSAGSGNIITSTERNNLHAHANRTVLDNISSSGSGDIITSTERSNLHTHSNKTVLDNISNSGSGDIITSTERTNLNSAYDHISKTTNPHNTGFSNAYDYNITDAFFKVNEGNAEQDAGMKVHVGSNVYQLFKWDATNGRWYLDADVHVEGNITAANEISAYSSASTGDIWDDMPVATATSLGGVKVDDSISDVYLDSNDVLQISIPSDAGQWDSITGGIEYTGGNVDITNGNLYVSGNTTIEGDLTVNGTEFITNTETVEIEDNLAIINSGETGDGVSAGFAGWEADRGTLTNYRWGFDESSDLWKIGKVGDLQAVVTRPDSVTDDTMALWDDANNRLKFLARSNINLSDFNIDIGLSNLSDYSTTNAIRTAAHTIEANYPQLRFEKPDAPTDQKYTRWVQASNYLDLRFYNDALDTYEPVYRMIRDGFTPTYVDFETELREQGQRVATRNWSTLQNVTEQGNSTDNVSQFINFNNYLDLSGKGAEIGFDTNENAGVFQSYDRTNNNFIKTFLRGNPIELREGNVNITDGNLQVDGTGDSYFAGNLSVGKTTAATGALDVEGNAVINGNFTVNQSIGSQFVSDEGDYRFYFTDQSGNKVLDIKDLDGNTTNMTISNSGVSVNDDITATNFTLGSDRRLKSNITPITDALTKALYLNPISFSYDDGRESIGFTAQNVQKMFPELVHKGSDGYLRLSYDQITAVNNAAIHELYSEIEKVKKENKRMKNEIQKLKSKINEICKQLDE